jgi:hypothetical protein
MSFSHTKTNIEELLQTKLLGLQSVQQCVIMSRPKVEMSKTLPFVAIIPGNEPVQVEDDSDIRYEADYMLYVLTKLDSPDVASLNTVIDDIKNLIYLPIDLGTYCLKTVIMEVEKTDDEDPTLTIDKHVSATVALKVIYYMTKGAA